MSAENDELTGAQGSVPSAIQKVYFGRQWHLYDLSHATRWPFPETLYVRDIWHGDVIRVHQEIAQVFYSLRFDCMYRAGDGEFILAGAFLEQLPMRRDPIPIGGGMYALDHGGRTRWSVRYLGISEEDACSVFVMTGLQHHMPADLLRSVQGLPPGQVEGGRGDRDGQPGDLPFGVKEAIHAQMASSGSGQVKSISLESLVTPAASEPKPGDDEPRPSVDPGDVEWGPWIACSQTELLKNGLGVGRCSSVEVMDRLIDDRKLQVRPAESSPFKYWRIEVRFWKSDPRGEAFDAHVKKLIGTTRERRPKTV